LNSCRSDLDVGVGIAPEKGNTREPVFLSDCLADGRELFGSHYANRGGEFGAGDLSPYGAGGNLDLRVVANALDLPQFAVRHEVELAVVFSKPDRRVHGDAALPKRGEADVALAVDFSGDGSHGDIVKCAKGSYGCGWISFLKSRGFYRSIVGEVAHNERATKVAN
jgi:hypothetical protein